MKLYPLLFTPILKDYLWGGRNLAELGRALPPTGVIAESWDIAAHSDGDSMVRNGHYAGQTLSQLHATFGLDLIGTNCDWAQKRQKFPLLIKLLDARQRLSVQVHPNDDYAIAHEVNELGKTEMWVVLQAESGAQVQLGVTAGTTPQLFRQAVAKGMLEPHLHYIKVKAGDHLCVPAGSLHTIMGGLLIVEIQQNSNTTYRVYDWNRVGVDGKPRPLHVEKALQVINFEQVEPTLCSPKLIDEADGVSRYQLCQNDYFTTERVVMESGAVYHGNCNGDTLEIWGVIEGQVNINEVALTAVQFTLLPAALGKFTVNAPQKATLLRIYVA